jgi:hypothetical protein
MADNITVTIEHRAEGYLLRVEIPRSQIDHLGGDGHWAGHLDQVVPLNDLPHAEDFDQPELVRIEIDVIPDDATD